ncbi:DUF5994 family protein [Mycolicibacterium goodii]|uniref:Uncharacterized protein n=1 Tax=Mycolicibacterium goodii TaxID=134601 RepID=A0ABS6HSR4_MYCGD|nr:DUF5994 family protein [Mycolicibacterium goodii]MBU8825722.1 hypothetical protein [Mycolicibacterium goodii]MBU8839953.1 hypothetical protein [Mycolicibacterium goodii]
MNGLVGSRRLASPVRLTLAKQFGRDIDGAWWPRSASVAKELPELVEVLQRPLGEIVDININWSPGEGQLDLNTIAAGSRTPAVLKPTRPRVMSVAGRTQCVKLLVVPHMTSEALGGIVMRCAAGMAVDNMVRNTALYETAVRILGTANEESTRWLARRAGGAAVPVATAESSSAGA